MDKSKLEAVLAQELARIRAELLAGDYQAAPARLVLIPKANGKSRPLGLPTLRDRLVQCVMLMAMEPTGKAISIAIPMGYGHNGAFIIRYGP